MSGPPIKGPWRGATGTSGAGGAGGAGGGGGTHHVPRSISFLGGTEPKVVAAPLEFEHVRLPGWGSLRKIADSDWVTLYTPRTPILYRGDRLRFEPTSRHVIVKALGVDTGPVFENRLVGPTSALVLASDDGPRRIFDVPTLEVGERYKMVVVSTADHDIDLIAWFEGRSVLS